MDDGEIRINSLIRIPHDGLLKTGYLHKLGGNKKGGAGHWQRRYFVLQKDLQYYESEEDFINNRPPKGVISLSSYYAAVAEPPNPNLEFNVFAVPFPLSCRAETSAELISWVETLKCTQQI